MKNNNDRINCSEYALSCGTQSKSSIRQHYPGLFKYYPALLILILFFINQLSFAQENWMARFSHLGNFYDIKAATEQYFSEDTSRINNKACGFKDYNRWLYFMEPRVDENGTMFSYSNALENERTRLAEADNGQGIPVVWDAVGPIYHSAPANEKALLGLVTSIWVDTSNFQTIYAGSNSSGLFVTYNGGDNWQSLTDKYMIPGVDVIIKHPAQPRTIYIGTGFFTWGKDYGVGVLKSKNNGVTWDTTGLNIRTFRNDPNYSLRNIGYRIGGMVQHTNNPDVLLALVVFEFDKESKIMRTDNGGLTWTEVYKVTADGNKQLFKIESHPLNPDYVLVSGSHVLKSTDFGLNWEQIDHRLIDTSTYRFLRSSTAMHPNDASKILVITANSEIANPNSGYNRLFLSTDAGNSFEIVKWYDESNPLGYEDFKQLTQVGYYKMEIEWSKTRNNSFYIGGKLIFPYSFVEPLRIQRDSLSETSTYHVDIRDIKTYKQRKPDGSINGWVYHGNDGGITKGLEADTVQWTDISRYGLNITQYYGIGIPGDGSGLIIGGTQDGNYDYLWNNTYKQQVGDAGDVVFDHENPQNVYRVRFMSEYYGIKSINSGETFLHADTFNITDPKRRNDAPIEMSKNNSKRLYIGGLDVWRTNNGFETTPQKISDLVKSDSAHIALKTIREAKSNSNVLYVARENPHWNCDTGNNDCDRRRLFKTTNGLSANPQWVDITPPTTDVPIDGAAISDLAVNPYNAHEFYIAMTRGIPGKQVYKGSGTGAISWENISAGLPVLPVNCLLYRDGSTLNELFAGTDAGIYYLNDLLDSWVPFGNGMPYTVISDMEIDYSTNELYAATFGRGIYKASLCFDPNNIGPINITNNQVWNNRIVTDDIIINTGAQLTILGTVQMGPNRQIIVQQGGKLIVNGGKITNGCSNHPWKGIIVQGNSSGYQNPSDQGIVSLSDSAVIENAYIGIHCINPAIMPIDGGGIAEDPSTRARGGGIVFAYDSKFVNNQIAVQFEPYSKNSISHFERCSFEINTALLSNFSPAYMVRFNQVNTINILGCSFISRYLDHQINGIYSYHSSFVVSRKCSSVICSESIPSSFENLNYAIYSLSRTGGKTFSVQYSNFTKNRRGVYANATDNLRISHNNITMYRKNPLMDDNISGIYLDNCTGYIVEENELQNMETYPGYSTYGIYINNSGETNNMVYKNNISNCSYGITAQDKNRNINGSAGLLLKCNQFNNVKMDISVLKTNPTDIEMGIAGSQGSNGTTCDTPAGNLFSNLAPSTGYYSIHNSGEFVNYFHHAGTQNDPWYPKIVTESSVSRQPTGHNYSIGCCPPSPTGGGGSSIIDGETAFYKSEAETTKATLSSLIDEGETSDKVLEVNLASPSEALDVRNSILQYSPFVSDTVLKSSINREELLNNAMIRDIMVANPHSAKSETLMQEVDMRLEPMPDYMKDEILEGVFVLSAKELMEAKRDMDMQFYNYGFNRLLSVSLTDSIPVPADTLMALLSADGSVESLMRQAWLLLENGDTTSALNKWNNISNEIPLTEAELTELSQQQVFMQWLIENQPIDTLDTEPLNNFLLYSSPSVTAAARGILVANNLLEYNEPYLEPDLTKSMEVRKPGVKPVNQEIAYLKVYPNPAKDFITIEYNTGNDKIQGVIEIINESGRKVYNKNLGRQFDQIILDTRNFKSGSYIFRLASGDKYIGSSSVIISH
ncbi:MAG: T9SS type A sorting domain-containing protein [Lentimicrobium sp.]|nr:T9SS type A sorting domain-containing protein [Lentimicrobium sp.]